jgi:hypothetical protein
VFRTIAWATDGSAGASEALPAAGGLARALDGNLVIIHVQELTISRAGFLVEDTKPLLEALHLIAER